MLAKPPGERDQADRAAFESHFEAGYRLAKGAGLAEQVCGWLLRGRERYDGRGPERLLADAIPIESRICRAACACATELVEAEPVAAIAALRASSGRELDPRVVEALAAALDRIAQPPGSLPRVPPG